MKKIKFTDHLNEGISNKYETIMLACQRTKNLNKGDTSYFDDTNHKNTVKALEEVEKEYISISEIRENLIRELQKNYKDDELQENYILEKKDPFEIDFIDSDIIKEISES